jgi:acetyltransferase-like isoleucine patch superfamily enzyme
MRVRALRAAGYHVGRKVYVGEGLHITDELFEPRATLRIGDRVSLAQRVLIVLSSHPNDSVLRDIFGTVEGDVTIEDDAWIGAAAVILPNVRIGAQAVVGAGAIVTKDVPARAIAVGNPARVTRYLDEPG